jgi:hypothetical protein
MPVWVKVAIDAWTAPAGVVDGYVFRPVNRGDQVQGDVLSEKVVWQMLRPYATAAGVPGIAAGGSGWRQWKAARETFRLVLRRLDRESFS